MTRALLRREVAIAAPADVVWAYVTDWPRQDEWVPFTRVERVAGPADGVGGRIRAWTGLGRIGFWDTMTITAFDRDENGGGRCEVLKTGTVVRGEGEFAVHAEGAGSRFVWAEMAVLPLGRVGSLGWWLARPLVAAMIDRGLASLRDRLESPTP